MAPELLHDGNNCNDGNDCDDGDNGDDGGGDGDDGDNSNNDDNGVNREASAAGDVWSFAMTALVSFDHL